MNFFKREDAEYRPESSSIPLMTGPWISLEKANRMLAMAGRVVFGEGDDNCTGWCENIDSQCTHQALLINIEPIKKEKDSADKLLKDFIEWHGQTGHSTNLIDQLAERAKKLLHFPRASE